MHDADTRNDLLPVLLLGVLALASCSSDDDGDMPSDDDVTGDERPPEDAPSAFSATFEALDCGELTTPAATTEGPLGDPSVSCGRVGVPSDWETPDGETIDLALYRFAPTGESPAPDPVVILTGGPGQSGASVLEDFVLGDSLGYLRERSELIVVDQRGTGFSRPSLICPESIAVEQQEDPTDGIGGPIADIDVESAAAIEANRACRDRLLGENVVFADYTTLNNARDIAAIRRALGVSEWNLFGISYGTDLALTVLREDPEGVRSVVLDSVLPPEVNLFSESGYRAYWAFSQIATTCMADADCAAAFDDIQDAIDRGLARLDAAPIGDFTLAEFVDLLREGVANPGLPNLIAVVADGDEASITEFVTAIRDNLAALDDDPPLAELPPELLPAFLDADAMNATVLCASEQPYLDARAGPDISAEFAESTRAAVEGLPAFYDLICPLYNMPPADPVVTRPVESDVPALVIAGTIDTITPPAWSILAADSLSRSQYAEFPGLGHSVIGSGVGCVGELVDAFLANPDAEVDQRCIDDLPRIDYEVDAPGDVSPASVGAGER